MKTMYFSLFLFLTTFSCSCQKESLEYARGDLQIVLEPGSAYLHYFPLFMGLKSKNPPQLAIWIEDLAGNYLSTVFVTRRIATGKWRGGGGIRRPEALPHWCFSRGVQYADGLYVPTSDQALPDALAGATPKEGFAVRIRPDDTLRRFVVKIELNHSIDFNEHFPRDAKEGDANYSGGTMGSGQPAVVYSALVDLDSGSTSFDATLAGHSSADGSHGRLQADVSTLTDARHIVKNIRINVQP